MQDREDVLPAGEERCAHCGEPHEEGDLYRLGGDGDWMCVPCIVGTDTKTSMWMRQARYLIRELVALLRCRGELTPTCLNTIQDATDLLEGR